jgi:hypothetical protein
VFGRDLGGKLAFSSFTAARLPMVDLDQVAFQTSLCGGDVLQQQHQSSDSRSAFGGQLPVVQNTFHSPGDDPAEECSEDTCNGAKVHGQRSIGLHG